MVDRYIFSHCKEKVRVNNKFPLQSCNRIFSVSGEHTVTWNNRLLYSVGK